MSFPITPSEMAIIDAIAERAEKCGIKGSPYQVKVMLWQIHQSVCPLRLIDLFGSKDMDFIHDIAGMIQHWNPESFTLDNCFLPRYARKQ